MPEVLARLDSFYDAHGRGAECDDGEGNDSSGDEDEETYPTKPKALLASAIQARAWDHGTYAGTGLLLKDYIFEDGPRMLGVGEERRYIQASEVDGYDIDDYGELPSEDFKPLRSVVVKTGAEEGHLETINCAEQKTIFTVPDQGSSFWYLLFMFYYKLRMFGWFRSDPLHRTWNDVKLA